MDECTNRTGARGTNPGGGGGGDRSENRGTEGGEQSGAAGVSRRGWVWVWWGAGRRAVQRWRHKQAVE